MCKRRAGETRARKEKAKSARLVSLSLSLPERLPRERDEKLESVMGRGETYETDVNFERRERGAPGSRVVETSHPSVAI